MKGSPADAKAFALKLLSYRSRSRKEMTDRLKRKSFSPETINSTIQFLENSGLIRDETLAEELIRYSTERKPLGRKGIELFLTKRGINKELMYSALSDHTQEIEEQSARIFVEKKKRAMSNYPADIVKRRLWGMLQRRGFSAQVISRVVDAMVLK